MNDSPTSYDRSRMDLEYSSRKPPIRVNETGHIHFVTTSCEARYPFMAEPASRQIVLNAMDEARSRKGFRVLGYVLMPEHAHFLLQPNAIMDISETVRFLKWLSSLWYHKEFARDQNKRKFWMNRFYDFNIFTQPKLEEKLTYCHLNPVKRGLVNSPEEWPHSSYRSYMLNDQTACRVDRWWEVWSV